MKRIAMELADPHGFKETIRAACSAHGQAVTLSLNVAGVGVMAHMTPESALDLAAALREVAGVCEECGMVLGSNVEEYDDRTSTHRGTIGSKGLDGCLTCIAHVQKEAAE